MVLVVIIFLGLFLRAGFWSWAGGLHVVTGSVDVDKYIWIFEKLISRDWAALSSYRPLQLIYPLLLSPIPLFGISAQPYVFLLHSALFTGSVAFAYLCAKKLFGEKSALVSALLLSMNWRMASWFNWVYSETIYYFAISLLCYSFVLLWKSKNRENYLIYFVACIFTLFVKTESIAPVEVSVLALLLQRFKWRFVLASVLCVIGISVKVIPRSAILSHIHVAHGLYLSTQTCLNEDGIEQDKAFTKLAEFNQSDDPLFKKKATAMSEYGIGLIKKHPIKYVSMFFLRCVSVLFPALFFSFNWLSRVMDLMLSLFLVIGSVRAVFKYKKDECVLGVFAIAASMLFIVGIYLSDGDTRFRLPIYLVLSILAPAGFMTRLTGQKVTGL